MGDVQPDATEHGRNLPRAAWISGTLASVLSTAALVWLGGRRLGKPFAPTNATSHWLWGDEEAFQALEPSTRHTAVGYATHHASACMWALLYHYWLARERERTPATILRDATVFGVLAAFVDYGLTPKRLTPGFEAHLRPAEIVGVFAAFSTGLAAGALLTTRHERALDRALQLEA